MLTPFAASTHSVLTGRPSRGVTLVELITLGVVLVVLAAIAIPSMNPILLQSRLRGAAWQVAGDLRLARQQAVTVKKRVRFCTAGCELAAVPGGYSIEQDNGPVGGPAVWSNETGVVTRLPPDVVVTSSVPPTFTVLGTATPAGGRVTVSNGRGTYVVDIAPSGRVLVCEGACP